MKKLILIPFTVLVLTACSAQDSKCEHDGYAEIGDYVTFDSLETNGHTMRLLLEAGMGVCGPQGHHTFCQKGMLRSSESSVNSFHSVSTSTPDIGGAK